MNRRITNIVGILCALIFIILVLYRLKGIIDYINNLDERLYLFLICPAFKTNINAFKIILELIIIIVFGGFVIV